MNGDECYQILGLAGGASLQEIKEAYRRLALKYHPDKNGSKKDVEKFKLVTEAYRVLRTGPVPKSKDSLKNGCYSETSFNSKMPNMYRARFEKILNEWVLASGSAVRASWSIRTYAESWRFLEGMVRRISSLLYSFRTECQQVPLFHFLSDDKRHLKKGFKTVRSKIQFWQKSTMTY